MLFITPFIRWLQLKRYQFEITMPVYMMTPAEKFIVCASLYLY